MNDLFIIGMTTQVGKWITMTAACQLGDIFGNATVWNTDGSDFFASDFFGLLGNAGFSDLSAALPDVKTYD